MKKILGFIALLTMTIGCKDIEKNPSGCDYGYVTNNNGECLSNSFSLGLKVQSANKKLYNRLFIKSYISERSSSLYWNTNAIANALAGDNIISKYVDFVITREKLSEVAAAHHKEMEDLYSNYYDEEIYDAYSKSNSYNNLLRESIVKTPRLFDRSISDYDFDELIELTNKKQSLLNDLNIYANESVLRVRDNNRNPSIEIPDHYSSTGKRILDKTRVAISEDENCKDRVSDCIEILKSDVRDNLSSLYQNLYIEL